MPAWENYADLLRRMFVEDGKAAKLMARELSVLFGELITVYAVRGALDRFGIRRCEEPVYEEKTCEGCGEPFFIRFTSKRTRRFCSHSCANSHNGANGASFTARVPANEVIAAYLAGDKVSSIGKRFGVTDFHVRRLARNAGIPPRQALSKMRSIKRQVAVNAPKAPIEDPVSPRPPLEVIMERDYRINKLLERSTTSVLCADPPFGYETGYADAAYKQQQLFARLGV